MNRLPVPVRFATTLLMLTLSALAVESGWPSATAGADDEDPYACGGEGEPRCAIDSLFAIENNFLKRCDRGLRSEDGICVNDTRYQLTAQLFQHTWAYWALNNQRRDLAGLQPLDTVMLLGAHNAYNNDADGYIHPNQEYSITDQLRAGIRVVDLDIHLDDDALLTGILPMLCHSSMASHLGCSRFDRWLVSAVKEIRHWMLQPENAIEVVVILLEDYVDEGMSTALINVPFQRFLADEPGIGVLTPDVLEHFQDTENTDHFPSQHWLVTHGKRVAILAQNDGFGDHLVIKRVRGQNSHRTFGTEINEFVPYPDCQLGTETHIATDPDGPMFAEVFGDQLEGGAERNLTASDVEELARCNVDFINMDDVLVDRGGGVEAPMKNAVWSWEEGDRGLGGDGAMRVAATGRWQSRPTDELHRFLCRRDDGGWVVTPGMGPWTHGWAACRTEFPDATFSVPVNGWQSERVTEERFPDDLWMNYHVVGDSDRWHINHAPDVQLAGPLASGEGAPVAFVPAVHDPDGTKIVAYAWDFGDGTTITTPEDGPIAHAFAEEGVYTVKLTATDELGASGEGQTTVDVGNTAPEVTAATDLTAVEGIAFGPITVAMFEDAGAMDTFEATIDWGDGVHRPAMASAPTVVGGFTYFDDGRFTIEVCVMDDDGGRGCATSTVAVSNTPPEASIDRSATVRVVPF